jgi:hypothetical protein
LAVLAVAETTADSHGKESCVNNLTYFLIWLSSSNFRRREQVWGQFCLIRYRLFWFMIHNSIVRLYV